MSHPLAIGSILEGRYRIDGIVGEGGMGIVLLATHVVLQQRVAIKVLRREAMVDAEAVERFVREARAAAQVKSDHVVRVQDVMTLADGTPYIVMEYVEGHDLAAMMESGPLPAERAIRYALQICEALAETHAAGIVHGDLKPENILVEGASAEHAGKVKILDFGISRIATEEGRRAGGQLVFGTPAYMAPEQFASTSFDARADIWALGVVLYEMLAGTPPFGSDPASVEARIASGQAPPRLQRSDVNPGLSAVIERCLERDPSRRIASAATLAATLEPYAPVESSLQRISRASTAQVVVHPRASAARHAATVVLPDRKKKKRGPLVAVFALLATIGLVAGGAAVFARRDEARPPTAEPPVAATAVTTTTVSSAVASVSAPEPPASSSASSAPAAPSASPASPAASARPRVHRPPGDRFGTRK